MPDERCADTTAHRHSQTRNPKHEIRNKLQTRNPKLKHRPGWIGVDRPQIGHFPRPHVVGRGARRWSRPPRLCHRRGTWDRRIASNRRSPGSGSASVPATGMSGMSARSFLSSGMSGRSFLSWQVVRDWRRVRKIGCVLPAPNDLGPQAWPSIGVAGSAECPTCPGTVANQLGRAPQKSAEYPVAVTDYIANPRGNRTRHVRSRAADGCVLHALPATGCAAGNRGRRGPCARAGGAPASSSFGNPSFRVVGYDLPPVPRLRMVKRGRIGHPIQVLRRDRPRALQSEGCPVQR